MSIVTPRRLWRVAVIGTAIAVVTMTATPADAAGPTTVTFDVTAGSLSISVPATAALGSGTPGSTITSQLGAVSVTDTRAQLTPTWTASVSTTTFTTGGATSGETIAKAAVAYASGTATATTGVGVFLPGQALVASAVALGSTQTAFSLTSGVGNNSASWNPTIVITVPAGAVAGTYTGTITQSVA